MGNDQSMNIDQYTNNDARKHEELRLLYETAHKDIQDSKYQQWKVTSYGLLLFAALIVITNLILVHSQISFAGKLALCLLALLVLAFCIYINWSLQQAINIARTRMKMIRESFIPASREIISKELSDKEEKFAEIWVVLVLLLILGLFTVWTLVFTLASPFTRT
jgi:hypothetical protein